MDVLPFHEIRQREGVQGLVSHMLKRLQGRPAILQAAEGQLGTQRGADVNHTGLQRFRERTSHSGGIALTPLVQPAIAVRRSGVIPGGLGMAQ